MLETSLIILSFLLGIICIRFIRSYNINKSESLAKMFAVTLWGGVVSMVISVVIYVVVAELYAVPLRSAIGYFLVVGPVEEFAKFAALASAFFIFKNEMNEPMNGLIYMSCVALGFSLIENYFYATAESGLSHLIILRLLISTPAHIMFSAFMGLAFYLYKKHNISYRFVLLTFFVASFLHGAYDTSLLSDTGLIFLLVVVKVSHSFLTSLLNYCSATSPVRKSLQDFIEGYEDPPLEQGLECISCGDLSDKPTFRTGKIRIQKCRNCDKYITSRDSLFSLFQYFASRFDSLAKLYRRAGKIGQKFDTLHSNNEISAEKKLAAFQLEPLSTTLEQLNKNEITGFRANRLVRKYLLEESAN